MGFGKGEWWVDVEWGWGEWENLRYWEDRGDKYWEVGDGVVGG